MAGMKKLAPRLQKIKETYEGDKQKIGKKTMELYKKEKINPAAGCLPILVQIPVFISIYWVLIEMVELRQTPFLYLPDLAMKDPYFILPLIMGASMWFQQRLNPCFLYTSDAADDPFRLVFSSLRMIQQLNTTK